MGPDQHLALCWASHWKEFHNPSNSSSAALHHFLDAVFDDADGQFLFFFAQWNMHLWRPSNLLPALGLCHLFCFVIKVSWTQPCRAHPMYVTDMVSAPCSLLHQQPCLQQTFFPQKRFLFLNNFSLARHWKFFWDEVALSNNVWHGAGQQDVAVRKILVLNFFISCALVPLCYHWFMV